MRLGTICLGGFPASAIAAGHIDTAGKMPGSEAAWRARQDKLGADF